MELRWQFRRAPRPMPETTEKPTRRLIVRELRQIHKGRTKNGAEYIIWQVIATTPEGRSIDQNLRTFEELPKGEVIECTVERFESQQYGVSFTLKQVGRRHTKDEIKELRQRVEALERAVYAASPPSTVTPAASPAPLPPPPVANGAPSPPPATAGLPSDQDIPF